MSRLMTADEARGEMDSTKKAIRDLFSIMIKDAVNNYRSKASILLSHDASVDGLKLPSGTS